MFYMLAFNSACVLYLHDDIAVFAVLHTLPYTDVMDYITISSSLIIIIVGC